MKYDKIALMRAVVYDPDLIYQKLKKGLDLIEFELPRNKCVLIKPNLISQNYPYQCTTTHPAIIEGICRLLNERNCRIRIGDSSAFYQRGNTDRAFMTSGIGKVAAKYQGETISFEKESSSLFQVRGGKAFKQVLLTDRITEADCIINVPKLKTHSFMRLSGAVKNLFGLVPGGTKYEYHFYNGYGRQIFGEKLADIYSVVKPALTIFDAVNGLEGFGPAATGNPKETGILGLSTNPYALDFTQSRIIGYDPYEIESISAGIRRNFLNDPERIEILGDFETLPHIPYKKAKIGKEKETGENDPLYNAVPVRPQLLPRKCSSCGICAGVCPFRAVEMNPQPLIDPRKCLNCYLCYYKCPECAIELRGRFFNPAVGFLRRVLRL